MKTVLVNIDDAQVNGEGAVLYAVVTVDVEDTEDTRFELWRADDEEHLREQVMLSFLGVETEEEAEGHPMANAFDDDWDFSIIHWRIGTAVREERGEPDGHDEYGMLIEFEETAVAAWGDRAAMDELAEECGNLRCRVSTFYDREEYDDMCEEERADPTTPGDALETIRDMYKH